MNSESKETIPSSASTPGESNGPKSFTLHFNEPANPNGRPMQSERINVVVKRSGQALWDESPICTWGQMLGAAFLAALFVFLIAAFLIVALERDHRQGHVASPPAASCSKTVSPSSPVGGTANPSGPSTLPPDHVADSGPPAMPTPPVIANPAVNDRGRR